MGLGPAVWLAPAKLNLFINILCRCPDGYHEMQTAFTLLHLFDELSYRVTENAALSLQTAGIAMDCPESENLVVRAAQQLKKEAGVTYGCQIHLKKKIPTGAGLGGGSSDAATTLIALNWLWKLHWSNSRLQELAKKIGHDVPFFIEGQTAWGIHRGETIKPSPNSKAKKYYLLIVPPLKILSSVVYQNLRWNERGQRILYDLFADDAYQHGNDLEKSIVELYPSILSVKQWLNQWGPACVSGSGSTVFCGFDEFDVAQKIKNNKEAQQLGTIFLTEALHQHPHHHWAHGFDTSSTTN